MRRERGLVIYLLRIAVVIAAVSRAVSAAAGESLHISGPQGLTGWKLTYVLDNQNEVSDTLVVARNGTRIRQIQGDPFIWRWMFLDDGKSIAIESGPLHFGMACILIDLVKGTALQRLNCFTYPDNPPLGGWPEWLTKLEESS